MRSLLRNTTVTLAVLSLLSCGDSDPAELGGRTGPDVARLPTQTLALALDAEWTPPSPLRTGSAVRHPRRLGYRPSYGTSGPSIGTAPEDEQFGSLPFMPDPLSPTSGSPSRAESMALARALRGYLGTGGGEDTSAIEAFLQAHPSSRWRASLLLNLGTIAYDHGYFQKALGFWGEAWNTAKNGSDPISERLANQAVAEYAKMNARVGRRDELDRVFSEVQGRRFMGDARVKMDAALEGRSVMEHKPGVAFRCGPYALVNIAPLLDATARDRTEAFLRNVSSPVEGFSLNDILAQSQDLGLDLQKARRSPGAPVVVPSVIHWRVGHYGALVRELDGRFLVKDPTFGNETWVSARALDEEASGFFLVPSGNLPPGWAAATDTEAALVFGKGHSGNANPDDTGPGDDKAPKPDCSSGPTRMAQYQMHVMLASLHVWDTPVGYAASVGPDVQVELAYNQREANQPTTLAFTSFSPQWVSTWISYVQDNPSSPNGNVTLRLRGGGGETHSGYNTGTQAYGMQPKTGAVLHKLTANTYQKVYPDGRVEYYEQYIGTTGPIRRVLLSRIVDGQGNELVIDYDSTYPSRISQIVDAAGLTTAFSYDYSGEPYLVTSIDDPFGRTASFTYTSVAGVLRLQSIEDTFGIVSSFGYADDGGMTSMTTPYGTTNFSLSPLILGSNTLVRYVEATDPYGRAERVEYNVSSAQTGIPGTINEPLPNPSVVSFRTSDNDDRNAFYWDKLAMTLAPGDHQKAHVFHWIQPTSADTATSILESERRPLEGRIWYNYPGQTQPYIMGTSAKPSVVARVVYDENNTAQTQATKYEYNTQNNLTKVTDPAGRETRYNYESNGIDVSSVEQKVGAGWETLAEYSYDASDPPHLPRTVTDAAGQTMSYAYNSAGQVTTSTNALGEVVHYSYEANPSNNGYGKVLAVTGDVPGGDVAFTYDDFDRVRTVSTTDGSTLTFDYDDLDRVTVVTHSDGSYEQNVYADQSLVASRDRAGRWTRHVYNKLRERVLSRDPAGHTTQFQWCRCGQLRGLVDGEGNLTSWTRDEAARVTRKTFADGSHYDYTYDFSGRLASYIDAMAQTKTYSYAIDDQLLGLDYSDSGTPDVTYAYDDDYNRLVTRTDGAGTWAYAYHPNDGTTLGAGQLARLNGPFPDDTLKYTYDELGRVKKTEIVDDSTYTTASYSDEATFDARRRVVGVTNNLGAFSYAYEGQSSRVDTIDYPNGMTVDYAYLNDEGDFMLEEIKNLNAAGPQEVISQFNYTYNQDRTIKTWTQVQAGLNPRMWTFGYDPKRQLTDAVKTSTAATLEEEHYAFDKAGNRTQLTDGDGTAIEVSNNLNQLTLKRGFGKTRFMGTVNELATVTVNGQPAKLMSEEGDPPYSFEASVDLPEGTSEVTIAATDGNSNLQSNTYEVTTTGTVAIREYDANGNLRFERAPNNDVIREFQWDQASRLVRVVAGEHETVFEYDGESRRIRIQELEDEEETENRVFVWCGPRICQKRDDAGEVVVRSYVSHGFEEGEDDYFETRDHLASIREVVADDGMTVASAVHFGPWGAQSLLAGVGVRSDFGFTGHYDQRVDDLALAAFRGYSPQLARWLGRDPIGIRGGTNLYAYVGGNAVGMIDPLGMAAVFNHSSKTVMVGGNTGPGDGHGGGGHESVPLPPSTYVNHENPLNTSDGNGLYDVDSIDFDNDGIAKKPDSDLDYFRPGEKVPGDDTWPAIIIYDDPGSDRGWDWYYCFGSYCEEINQCV